MAAVPPPIIHFLAASEDLTEFESIFCPNENSEHIKKNSVKFFLIFQMYGHLTSQRFENINNNHLTGKLWMQQFNKM